MPTQASQVIEVEKKNLVNVIQIMKLNLLGEKEKKTIHLGLQSNSSQSVQGSTKTSSKTKAVQTKTPPLVQAAAPPSIQTAKRFSARHSKLEKFHKEKENIYKNGVKMWESQTADVDGVLLQCGEVNSEDIQESKRILERYIRDLPYQKRALDCAAGIGRVSKQILTHHFAVTDLLEPAANFVQAAK